MNLDDMTGDGHGVDGSRDPAAIELPQPYHAHGRLRGSPVGRILLHHFFDYFFGAMPRAISCASSSDLKPVMAKRFPDSGADTTGAVITSPLIITAMR